MFILFYFTGFCSIIIYSFFNNNEHAYKVLVAILVLLIFIISINSGGGDLENYERYFYGLRSDFIITSQWLNDFLKLFIKLIFNESNLQGMPLKIEPEYSSLMNEYLQENHYGFIFYKIITHIVFILGGFSLINSTSYFKVNMTKILFLLLPITMTFMTSSIEQSLSLGIVFFALSKIQDSKFYFILLLFIAGFIHWSSWMYIPLVFYDRKIFLEYLILSLIFILLFRITNLDIALLAKSLIINLNIYLESNFIDMLTENIEDAMRADDRNLNWHHIYLSSVLVLFSFISYFRFRILLNSNNKKKSILLISTLGILMVTSLIFEHVDNYIVRLSAVIKIISLICFMNTIYCINKHTQLVNMSLGFILVMLGVYSFN